MRRFGFVFVFSLAGCLCGLSVSGVAQDQQMEELLETMNDALLENRKLRENMETVQEAFERMTVENNVLKSRVRTLEKTIEENELAQKRLAAEDEKQQVLMQQLQEEKETLYQTVIEKEQQIETERDRLTDLKEILDRAILEEERAEYENLIRDASKKADELLGIIANLEEQKRVMNDELVEAYFILGNSFYEVKNYEGAVKQYKKVLDWNPSHGWAHHNLAIIFDYYLHDHVQARYHYERYLDVKPVDEEALKIRERVMALGLMKKLVPTDPLRIDYNEYQSRK